MRVPPIRENPSLRKMDEGEVEVERGNILLALLCFCVVGAYLRCYDLLCFALLRFLLFIRSLARRSKPTVGIPG